MAWVTDTPSAVDALAGELESGDHDLVAVLVPADQLLFTRAVVPAPVRCATHPKELLSLTIDAFVVRRGQERPHWYRDMLADLAPVLVLEPSGAMTPDDRELLLGGAPAAASL